MKGFGLTPIKNEGEARESGEFEYKMAKCYLSEAYRMAKRSNELGYARIYFRDLIDLKEAYENIFCEKIPKD